MESKSVRRSAIVIAVCISVNSVVSNLFEAYSEIK